MHESREISITPLHVENITLYDNKAVSAKVEPAAGHKYKVTLVVDARKLRASGDGAETQIPIHDLIEVGIFKGKKESEHGSGSVSPWDAACSSRCFPWR